MVPVCYLLEFAEWNSASMTGHDFVFYILLFPIFTLLLMKSIYFQQNTMVARQAIDRLDNLLNYPKMQYSGRSRSIKNTALNLKRCIYL